MARRSGDMSDVMLQFKAVLYISVAKVLSGCSSSSEVNFGNYTHNSHSYGLACTGLYGLAVLAHATALNWTDTFLMIHEAKTLFVTDEDPRGQNVSLKSVFAMQMLKKLSVQSWIM